MKNQSYSWDTFSVWNVYKRENEINQSRTNSNRFTTHKQYGPYLYLNISLIVLQFFVPSQIKKLFSFYFLWQITPLFSITPVPISWWFHCFYQEVLYLFCNLYYSKCPALQEFLLFCFWLLPVTDLHNLMFKLTALTFLQAFCNLQQTLLFLNFMIHFWVTPVQLQKERTTHLRTMLQLLNPNFPIVNFKGSPGHKKH